MKFFLTALVSIIGGGLLGLFFSWWGVLLALPFGILVGYISSRFD